MLAAAEFCVWSAAPAPIAPPAGSTVNLLSTVEPLPGQRARSEAADGGVSYLQRPQGA